VQIEHIELLELKAGEFSRGQKDGYESQAIPALTKCKKTIETGAE
jgi:hypothetical protein